MRIEEVTDPVPEPGQVRIRVHAAGVNPVDVYIRSGAYAKKPALPYTPGADLGGVVDAVGTGVSRVHVGDRVYAHAVPGACAERAVCDAWQVNPLPDDISFEQGAAIGIPYGTAWRALVIRGQARAGETVLVHGASGGVGIAAVQLARARGLRVIGTAGTEAGLALVRAQGAELALNHREADYLHPLMPAAGGHGVDLVLEMLANVNLDRDLDVLAPRGRVVVIGNRGRIEIDPRKAMSRDASILGMSLVNATRDDHTEIHAGLVAGLATGIVRPVISRSLPLADAAEAHRLVMEPGAAGKIVLVM